MNEPPGNAPGGSSVPATGGILRVLRGVPSEPGESLFGSPRGPGIRVPGGHIFQDCHSIRGADVFEDGDGPDEAQPTRVDDVADLMPGPHAAILPRPADHEVITVPDHHQFDLVPGELVRRDVMA